MLSKRRSNNKQDADGSCYPTLFFTLGLQMDNNDFDNPDFDEFDFESSEFDNADFGNTELGDVDLGDANLSLIHI